MICNGDYNDIICNRKNSNFNKIDNGFNNRIELNQTTSNNIPNEQNYFRFESNNSNGCSSNFSIRIDNNNRGSKFKLLKSQLILIFMNLSITLPVT